MADNGHFAAPTADQTADMGTIGPGKKIIPPGVVPGGPFKTYFGDQAVCGSLPSGLAWSTALGSACARTWVI
jgi:hypothetical protein